MAVMLESSQSRLQNALEFIYARACNSLSFLLETRLAAIKSNCAVLDGESPRSRTVNLALGFPSN